MAAATRSVGRVQAVPIASAAVASSMLRSDLSDASFFPRSDAATIGSASTARGGSSSRPWLIALRSVSHLMPNSSATSSREEPRCSNS